MYNAAELMGSVVHTPCFMGGERMPVFRSGRGEAPAWCELGYFEIVNVAAGKGHALEREGKKEKLIVGSGRCNVSVAGDVAEAGEGADLDLKDEHGSFEVVESIQDSVLIRMCGRWGEETGGSGLFTVDGSRVFDNHYHDCDEYWIIFEGSGIAVSEGKEYKVGPGDCVATGMGHHHDFPRFFEPVRAVYFETTVAGQKRRGHLWEDTHGKAEPRMDRI